MSGSTAWNGLFGCKLLSLVQRLLCTFLGQSVGCCFLCIPAFSCCSFARFQQKAQHHSKHTAPHHSSAGSTAQIYHSNSQHKAMDPEGLWFQRCCRSRAHVLVGGAFLGPVSLVGPLALPEELKGEMLGF